MADYLIKRANLGEGEWRDTPPAPLKDGAARFRVDQFALTANNVTYAAFGEAMGYWNFFQAPDGFGRVPVWGFATVTESKVPGVAVGQRVYGYLPMSDSVDLEPVKVNAESFQDGAANRSGLAPIYNTYIFTAADPSYDSSFEAQQMLFRPLFTTGWMLDDALIETGDPIPETVVLSSASSKTALALAHCLKRRGSVDTVGLTSPGNKAWLEGTGLYGRVRTYDDVDRLHARGATAYVDFLGRPAFTADLHNALRDRLVRSLTVGATDWQASRAPVKMPGPSPEFFFVPTYAAERAKTLGAAELNQRLGKDLMAFYRASKSFVTPHAIKGRAATASAWSDTLASRVPPDQGLIVSL